MDRPDSPEAPDAADPDPTGGLLTARELEVVRALVASGSTARVAATLSISSSTVNRHLDNAREKCAVHSTVELLALAVRLGWVAAV